MPAVIIEKNLTDSVRTIETFFSECCYEVNSRHKALDKAVAKTSRKEEGFFFEFSKMFHPSVDERNEISYSSTLPLRFANDFKVIDFDLMQSKSKFSWAVAGYISISGYINEFTTNFLSDHLLSYYRAVVPTESDQALSGFFYHNNMLRIGDTTYGSGVLEITINGISLHLFSYTLKESKKSFFIVESQSTCAYNDFASIQDEIILAITYLTGKFLGKEIYILGSKTNDFEETNVLGLKRFFDDLKNGNPAIANVNVQHQVKAKPQRCSVIFLENLTHQILNSLIYKRTLLLVCQGHTEPPYVTSTLHAVALETITNEIAEQIDEKIRPIKEKNKAQDLRNKLQVTLAAFKDQLSEEAFLKISADITRINSPTNKQKLLQPFKHLNIKLTAKEIDAIERRNDFLHGKILEPNNKHYLALITCRLLYCVNCLVLKHVGFEGYVVYFPSTYQLNHNLPVEDDFIKKI